MLHRKLKDAKEHGVDRITATRTGLLPMEIADELDDEIVQKAQRR